MTDMLFGRPVKIVETDDPVPQVTFGEYGTLPKTVMPSSSRVTETIPDGIPIGQQPSKACEHDFNFLRNVKSGTDINGVKKGPRVDEFYCRKCLEYREVER